MFELVIFVADYSLPHTVPACLFVTLDPYFAKAVVDKFVHETVEQCLATVSADSIGSLSVVKVLFFNLREFVRCTSVKY